MGKTLLVILRLMSALSWYLVVLKGVTLMTRRRCSQDFLNHFWNAASLDEVQHEIAPHGTRDPCSHLTVHASRVRAHHEKKYSMVKRR